MKKNLWNFKNFKRYIALAMSTVMAVSAPLQTFAATGKKEYISDLKIAYGNNSDEAKNWLEEEGYQVLDQDLNNVELGYIDKMFVDKRSVYLGYKTTDDPTDAIRDLKTMNMENPGYSFEDYQKLLEKEKDEINVFLHDFHLTLNEYRENYANGVSRAMLAHDTLNKLYEDDTEQLLGDLLLNETVQEMDSEEYEALSDEEKKEHADMVTILMQGNGQLVLAIEQNLYLGADTDPETTFLDRLATMESFEEFEINYITDNTATIDTESEGAIMAAMKDTYGNAASMIADKLEDFKETMSFYTEHELFGEEDAKKIDNYFSDDEKPMDFIIWSNLRSLYNRLNEIPYEDGTMYDFIMSEEYDFTGQEQYLFYPMVSVLSEGQIACLPYVSLTQMLNEGISEEEGCDMVYSDISSVLQGEDEAVSVYTGINRALFSNSGVAVTTSAQQLANSDKGSFLSGFLGNAISNVTSVLLLTTLAGAAITIGAKTTGMILNSKFMRLDKALCADLNKTLGLVSHESGKVITSASAYKTVNSIDMNDLEGLQKLQDQLINHRCSPKASAEIVEQIETTQQISKSAKMASRIGTFVCVATFILAGISIWQTYEDLSKYYNHQRTPVPEYMVDSSSDGEKIKDFTYYAAVTCNRKEGGFDATKVAKDPSILGDCADLNGDVGQQWLALYYTKNENAGDPITTDILIQADTKNVSGNYTALTMFGSEAAINLNDEAYLYGKGEPLYLMYVTDNDAGLAGSTFGGSNMMILIALAAILAGAGFAAIRYRKKEENVSIS